MGLGCVKTFLFYRRAELIAHAALFEGNFLDICPVRRFGVCGVF